MAISTEKARFKNNLFVFNGNTLLNKENWEITHHEVIMVKSHITGKSIAFRLVSVGEDFHPECGETIAYEFVGLDAEYSNLKVKVSWW